MGPTFVSKVAVHIVWDRVRYETENFMQPVQRETNESSDVTMSHALGFAWPLAWGLQGVNGGVNDQTFVTEHTVIQERCLILTIYIILLKTKIKMMLKGNTEIEKTLKKTCLKTWTNIWGNSMQ